jgi:hypothetical protein
MHVSELVRRFFEEYERHTNALDPEQLASRYSEAFMFADPYGTRTVKREEFLQVLPKRAGFFKAIGLASSTVHAIEETRLDPNYVLAKVYWKVHFEKEAMRPVKDEISATYLLHQQNDGLRIVFQLDHQDLVKRVQDIGLFPARVH